MIASGRVTLYQRDPLSVLNQYRAAEIHGAGAIMRMGRLADSSELSTDLSRHMRDDLLALTWVSERRGVAHYAEHAVCPQATR